MLDNNKKPDPFIYGYGSKTGAQFTQQYAADRETTSLYFYCWFQGFLTSFNVNRGNHGQPPLNYAATPMQIIDDQAFLRLYCEEHPAEMFAAASLMLINAG